MVAQWASRTERIQDISWLGPPSTHLPRTEAFPRLPLLRPGSAVTHQRSTFCLGGSGRPRPFLRSLSPGLPPQQLGTPRVHHSRSPFRSQSGLPRSAVRWCHPPCFKPSDDIHCTWNASRRPYRGVQDTRRAALGVRSTSSLSQSVFTSRRPSAPRDSPPFSATPRRHPLGTSALTPAPPRALSPWSFRRSLLPSRQAASRPQPLADAAWDRPATAVT